MLHPQVANLLKQLENLMRDGTLTRATNVDSETFVCFTEKVGGSIAYHQCMFEQLPRDFQIVFRGQSQGQQLGPFKIVAVFDIWLDAPSSSLPPMVKRYAA